MASAAGAGGAAGGGSAAATGAAGGGGAGATGAGAGAGSFGAASAAGAGGAGGAVGAGAVAGAGPAGGGALGGGASVWATAARVTSTRASEEGKARTRRFKGDLRKFDDAMSSELTQCARSPPDVSSKTSVHFAGFCVRRMFPKRARHRRNVRETRIGDGENVATHRACFARERHVPANERLPRARRSSGVSPHPSPRAARS